MREPVIVSAARTPIGYVGVFITHFLCAFWMVS